MPKARTRRGPTKSSERQDQYISFFVSRAQLRTYKAAATIGFKGDLSEFLRAAADALAAQFAGQEEELRQERAAFWREVAELLRDKLRVPPEP